MMLPVWLLLFLPQIGAKPTMGSSPPYQQPVTVIQNEPEPSSETFTEDEASHLLRQISQGLVSRNQTQVLGAFDLSRMQNGALFRQQIVSFIAHAENIRLYFHVTQVSGAAEKSEAEADVEMEADPRDGNNALPIHKQARVHLIAQNTSGGWKFTEMQPRGFFSLQP
ncbi:MAG TPA: hypothetical protein VJN64_08260 [Terriglobales bacterium]|nr:hypothetical protein [Terriglobales bacterium]